MENDLIVFGAFLTVLEDGTVYIDLKEYTIIELADEEDADEEENE